MSLLANVPPGDSDEGLLASEPLARRTRLIVYAIGTAIFVASLVYLGVRIVHQWHAIARIHIEFGGWLGASIAIYALSHISTGLAWPFALRSVGARMPLREGLKIGLVAQIGKYLPGNVAHYFGRAALAKTAGVTLRYSGLSTLIEIGCALIAASLLAPIVLLADPHLQVAAPVVSGLLVVGVIAAIATVVRRVSRRTTEPISVHSFAAASAVITVSLLLSGLSAYFLLASIGEGLAPMWYVVGAFALSWITGLLTPGAPGGLGVRESVLIVLLGSYLSASAALAIALLHRLITTLVDLAAGLFGYLWFVVEARSKK